MTPVEAWTPPARMNPRALDATGARSAVFSDRNVVVRTAAEVRRVRAVGRDGRTRFVRGAGRRVGAVTAAAEHLHVRGDDLGGGALLALLVLPLPGLDAALEVDLPALHEVLPADL